MNISKNKLYFLNNAMKWNDLVMHYKSTDNMKELLSDTQFFQKVMKADSISTYNVTFLINKLESKDELQVLNKNSELLYYLLKKSLIGFDRLVVFYKSLNGLDLLLSNEKLFKKLGEFQKNNEMYLDTEKLGFLLGKIDSKEEVEKLIYNEYLLIKLVDDGKFNKLVSIYKNFDYLDLLIESVEFFEAIQHKLTPKNYEHLLKNVESKNSFEVKSLVNLNIGLLKKGIVEGCDLSVKLYNKLTEVLNENLRDAQFSAEEKEEFQEMFDLLRLYRFLGTLGLNQIQKKSIYANAQNKKVCFEFMMKEPIVKEDLMKNLVFAES